MGAWQQRYDQPWTHRRRHSGSSPAKTEHLQPAWSGGIRSRAFEPRDAEAPHALAGEAYRGLDSRYVPTARDDRLGWMTGDPEFDATVWRLVERESEPFGSAPRRRTGRLKDVAVYVYGHGTVGALVDQGVGELARVRVEGAALEVRANSTRAVPLDERLGFVVGRRGTSWGSSL